jgi:hypothetical protein
LRGKFDIVVNGLSITLFSRPALFVVGYFPDFGFSGETADNDVPVIFPVVDDAPDFIGLRFHFRRRVTVK